MGKVIIKQGASLEPLVQELSGRGEIFVVYDRNVEAFAAPLTALFPSFGILADEEHKDISSVMDICRFLLESEAGRDALVLAVGGGVTSDLVGFAAGIYKRGVACVNVPTSLLAMVDAAIGGKSGVNVDSFKNMVGLIRQPLFTFLCPAALRTLPPVHMLSGAAEMLKTFLLFDPASYREAVGVFSAGATLEPLIAAAASYKAAIVEEDEFENGRRRLLNLGHTYGHAIEWWQRRQTPDGVSPARVYTHGEAVAIGIIRAAEISESLGIAREGLAAGLKADFESCGLPTELPCPAGELEQAIRQDKKAEGSQLNIVLLEDIGKPVIKPVIKPFI